MNLESFYVCKNQIFLLISTLTGLALVHKSFKDKWGWGSSGSYSAANGYLAYQQLPHDSSLIPVFWKSLWSSYCLPKVNFFT